MCKNIKLNYCDRLIIPHNKAVGGSRKTLRLDRDFKDSIGANLNSARGKARVKQITFLDAVERLHGKTYMLKCNIEGGEKEVFADKAANEKAFKNCVYGRIAWHYDEYPSWLIEHMPRNLNVKVLKGASLSTGDHPYTLLLSRRQANSKKYKASQPYNKEASQC